MPGKLFLVATPIGNLQDITFRALETLKAADMIACEDTRHSRKLLTHFGITGKLVSYHEHNEEERSAELSEALAAGANIAVVSDAGTPGISDPCFRLVTKAIASGAEVIPVPGPVAFVSAAVSSGLPTDSIFFGGFLPSKKGERRKRLEELRDVPATLVFHETPHRLRASLEDCLALLGDRSAAVARELTKLHEETVRGRVSELIGHFERHAPKGELVLILDRSHSEPQLSGSTVTERLAELEREGLDRKAALKKAAKEFGISKSEAYREMMGRKK